MIAFNMAKNNSYFFPILLILSILTGGAVGYFFPHHIIYLKPVGDIFINLILAAVVPLVFFSVASSIDKLVATKRVKKIFLAMMFTFLATGIIASLFMIAVVMLFPPAANIHLNFSTPPQIATLNLQDQLVSMLTVKDFTQLFSHKHLLPLIFFAMLVGFASGIQATQNKLFSNFLAAGCELFSKLINLIMHVAPIGFFAYFAVLISELGPKLLAGYFHIAILYYVAGVIYFIVAFSLYAYLASNKQGIKLFWKNIYLPTLTSLATCSSAMSIPANMQATKQMRVDPAIYESAIPLGAFLHKEGSVLGGVVKIAFLFGIFHLSFTGANIIIPAIFASILVGTIMGAIPSGGMLGELLILSLYGFPPESLLMIAAISLIIDPLATMLNVTGDCASALLIGRFVGEKNLATEVVPTKIFSREV